MHQTGTFRTLENAISPTKIYGKPHIEAWNVIKSPKAHGRQKLFGFWGEKNRDSIQIRLFQCFWPLDSNLSKLSRPTRPTTKLRPKFGFATGSGVFLHGKNAGVLGKEKFGAEHVQIATKHISGSPEHEFSASKKRMELTKNPCYPNTAS